MANKFEIYSDHLPLKTIFTSNNIENRRLLRMRLQLADFDFSIVYVKGKENVIPDYLSRDPNENVVVDKESDTEDVFIDFPVKYPVAPLNEQVIDPILVVTRAQRKGEKIVEISDLEKFLKDEELKSYFEKNLAPKLVSVVPDFENVIFVDSLPKKIDKLKFFWDEDFERITFDFTDFKGVRTYFYCLPDIEQNSLHYFWFVVAKLAVTLIEKYSHEKFVICTNWLKGILKDEFRQIWSILDKPDCKLLFYVEDRILVEDDEELKKNIVSYHENPAGAHRGVTKTFLAMKERYFCKNLYQKIKRYISSCLSCQKIKGQRRVKQSMTLTGCPPYPFHTIAYDFFGPLVSSDTMPSYTSILTITCLFSRFLILVPTVDQSAETVAKALMENVILTYGMIPEVVLSDCAQNFKSKMISQVMKLLRIRKTHSLPYSPWINGIGEKKNLQIKYFLQTTYLETGKRTNWPNSIKFVSYSYNSTTNSATGFSPFQLIFGLKYRNLCDLHVSQLPYAKTYGDYLSELHGNIQLMQDKARENVLEAQRKSKNHYDSNSKEMPLKLGDLVLMQLPNADKLGKFEPKYIGPFEVVSSTEKAANIKKGKQITNSP